MHTNSSIELDGTTLTIDQVLAVAYQNTPVALSGEAVKRVARAGAGSP